MPMPGGFAHKLTIRDKILTTRRIFPTDKRFIPTYESGSLMENFKGISFHYLFFYTLKLADNL